MTPYMVNLTNDLIRSYDFDVIAKQSTNRKTLHKHIRWGILAGSVNKMNPATLGKIQCSFHAGDILSEHPGQEISFGVNLEEYIRELVAFCLADAILQRISPVPGYTPPLTGEGRGTVPPPFVRKKKHN
jgi:hypothetical protein